MTSGISSTTSQSQLLQWLQTTGASQAQKAPPSGPPPARPEGQQEESADVAGATSQIDPGQLMALQDDIDQAISNALAEAGGGDTDMESVIKQAVDGVLSDNNIDPDQFHQMMQSMGPGAGGMPPPGSGGSQGGPMMPPPGVAGDAGSGDPSASGMDLQSLLAQLPAGSFLNVQA